MYFLDMPIQTATGTIAIHVEDLNDNCPVLISTQEYLCSGTERFNVTAEDLDANPNGAPLKFTLVSEESMGAWMVEEISGEYLCTLCKPQPELRFETRRMAKEIGATSNKVIGNIATR